MHYEEAGGNLTTLSLNYDESSHLCTAGRTHAWRAPYLAAVTNLAAEDISTVRLLGALVHPLSQIGGDAT